MLECRRILAEVFFDRCAMRIADGQYRLYQHARRLVHNRFDSSIFGLHYQSSLRQIEPKWVFDSVLSNMAHCTVLFCFSPASFFVWPWQLPWMTRAFLSVFLFVQFRTGCFSMLLRRIDLDIGCLWRASLGSIQSTCYAKCHSY